MKSHLPSLNELQFYNLVKNFSVKGEKSNHGWNWTPRKIVVVVFLVQSTREYYNLNPMHLVEIQYSGASFLFVQRQKAWLAQGEILDSLKTQKKPSIHPLQGHPYVRVKIPKNWQLCGESNLGHNWTNCTTTVFKVWWNALGLWKLSAERININLRKARHICQGLGAQSKLQI